MKSNLLVTGTFLLTIAAVSTSAMADVNGADKSRNAFIDGSILAKWKPEVTSVSNSAPNVNKTLGAYGTALLGQSTRDTSAIGNKTASAEVSSHLFTSQFQKN